uniref:t-SNARE coiled-coil homology domain-containing protein n=1 Tax=Acrobeloides nanus TaxID=290746 RepID=A0A914ECY0_9BILA
MMINNTQADDRLERKLFHTQSFPSESTLFLNEEHWEDVEAFLEQIKNLHSKMDEMKEYLKDMREIHEIILKSPFADPTLSKKLNFEVESFKSHSYSINNVLKALNHDIKYLVESEANFRIKKNHMMTTNHKFHNLMVEFNNEQVIYREKSQQRIRSYLQISGVEMDNDAIEEAIKNGHIFDMVSIFMAERNKTDIFEDIKSRHADILKLEASIKELHEIFQDLSMLVENQGEILNNIEENINSANYYVHIGKKNVVTAKKIRDRNIKEPWFIYGALTLYISIFYITFLMP